MKTGAYLAGTGFFVPARIVTNQELSELVDTSDAWITARTGIKTRHLIDPKYPLTTVDMAEQAAIKALEDSQTNAEDLDMIVLASASPDYRLPSGACLLQNRLGAKAACAFDIVAACAGSLHALAIANQFLDGKKYKNILVVGAELMSSAVDWSDRNTCVLFGDAASAAVLKKSKNPEHGFVDFDFYADGSQWQNILMPHGGKVQMKGSETFKFAVRALSAAAQDILEKNNLKPSDIKQVIAHQANLRIIEAISDRILIPMERFMINIDRYANTSSASLLLTYDEAKSQGRIDSGDWVLMMAVGAGFVWGVALYKA
ncbi:MAG: beta-ketoacyl-ACP synthase III [Myxococcaceae bacterium]